MTTAHRAAARAATVPGPQSRSLHDAERPYLAPGLQRIAQLSELTIERGSGCTLVDVDGNEYLDFFAGVAVASLGHSHPRFVKALQAQLERWIGRQLHQRGAPGAARAARRAGARRAAPHAALQRRRRGRRGGDPPGQVVHQEVRGRRLLGRLPRQDRRRHRPDRRRVEAAAGARCRPARTWCPTPTATAARSSSRYPDCGIACLDFAREQLKATTAGAIAAIIVEPMQGTAGNVIPPPEFLPGVQAIAKRARRAADRRRDDHRLRPHRQDVRLRAHRHRARRDDHRQGLRLRLPGHRPDLDRRDRRVDAVRASRARRRRATAATRWRRPRRSTTVADDRRRGAGRERRARRRGAAATACARCRRSTSSSATCAARGC